MLQAYARRSAGSCSTLLCCPARFLGSSNSQYIVCLGVSCLQLVGMLVRANKVSCLLTGIYRLPTHPSDLLRPLTPWPLCRSGSFIVGSQALRCARTRPLCLLGCHGVVCAIVLYALEQGLVRLLFLCFLVCGLCFCVILACCLLCCLDGSIHGALAGFLHLQSWGVILWLSVPWLAAVYALPGRFGRWFALVGGVLGVLLSAGGVGGGAGSCKQRAACRPLVWKLQACAAWVLCSLCSPLLFVSWSHIQANAAAGARVSR